MAEENNRTSRRIDYEANLETGPFEKDRRLPAMMRNYSDGGMYFESDTRFSPGDIINIHMKHHSEDVSGPEGGRLYRARVQWCRPLSRNDARTYGIGIQYLENYDHYPQIIR